MDIKHHVYLSVYTLGVEVFIYYADAANLFSKMAAFVCVICILVTDVKLGWSFGEGPIYLAFLLLTQTHLCLDHLCPWFSSHFCLQKSSRQEKAACTRWWGWEQCWERKGHFRGKRRSGAGGCQSRRWCSTLWGTSPQDPAPRCWRSTSLAKGEWRLCSHQTWLVAEGRPHPVEREIKHVILAFSDRVRDVWGVCQNYSSTK